VNEVGYTIKYHMHGACLLNLSEWLWCHLRKHHLNDHVWCWPWY
jgi:hypothetical protein